MLLQYLSYQLYSKPATFDKRVQMTSYYQERECDVNTAYAIITDGRTWRCGRYDLEAAKGFGKSNVIDVQFIALDFDKIAASPRDIVEYAINIGFMPNFYYYSYSQGIKPGNNFRVVWCLAESITPTMYENLYRLLLEKFSCFNPDKSTKDCSRLWYGNYGQGGGIVSEKPLSLANIGFINLAALMEEGRTPTQVKRIKTNNVPKYVELDVPDKVIVSSDWKNRLKGTNREGLPYCSLWKKWCDGEYLNYNERLVLFTNLKYLEDKDCSKTLISSILEANPNWKQIYEGHTFDETQLLTIIKSKLAPLPIVRYLGGYYTVADFFRDTPDVKSLNRKVEQPNYISIDELDSIMDELFPQYMNEPGYTYIKAQTGSGKTERAITWLLQQDYRTQKFIYAVPTYKLAEEFYERLKKALAPKAAFGKAFDTSEEVLRHVHLIPKCNGMTKRDSLRLLLGLRRENKDNARNSAIFNMIDSESTGIFICTHALLVNLGDFKANTIIIDENIEDAFINRIDVSAIQLRTLYTYKDEYYDFINDFIKEVDNQPFGSSIDVQPLIKLIKSIDVEDYITNGEDIIIPGLFKICSSRYNFIKGKKKDKWTIRATGVSPLLAYATKNGTRVKFLTATSQKASLDNFTKGVYDIQYRDFPLARMEGKVIQYMGKTGAKGLYGSNAEQMIEYIKSRVPNYNEYWVLTFKDWTNTFKEAGFNVPSINGDYIHLANNAGLDFLKGKKIIVCGKYDKSDEDWINDWYALHPDSQADEQEALERVAMTITMNGINQRLFLFKDKELNEMQLEFIQKAIEQTAGRVRAIRESASEVLIFCNYIYPDVKEIRE